MVIYQHTAVVILMEYLQSEKHLEKKEVLFFFFLYSSSHLVAWIINQAMCLRSSLFSPGEEAAGHACTCVCVCVTAAAVRARLALLAQCFCSFMAAYLLDSKCERSRINKH